MTHSRALRLALAALGKWSSGRDMDAVELNDLIATLEAALEQPKEGAVALERERAVELTRAYQEGYERGSRNAQPEQEPVAWMQIGLGLHDGDVIAKTIKPKHWNPEWWRFEPLYTHPPRREWQGSSEAWKCACGANLYIDADGKPRSKANG